jgi:hypothetical protein
MAEDGGVEPHPISQNPVFKAGRSTNTAASSSVTLVPNSGNDPLAYRLSSDCSTSELIGNIFGAACRNRTYFNGSSNHRYDHIS